MPSPSALKKTNYFAGYEASQEQFSPTEVMDFEVDKSVIFYMITRARVDNLSKALLTHSVTHGPGVNTRLVPFLKVPWIALMNTRFPFGLECLRISHSLQHAWSFEKSSKKVLFPGYFHILDKPHVSRGLLATILESAITIALHRGAAKGCHDNQATHAPPHD